MKKNTFRIISALHKTDHGVPTRDALHPVYVPGFKHPFYLCVLYVRRTGYERTVVMDFNLRTILAEGVSPADALINFNRFIIENEHEDIILLIENK